MPGPLHILLVEDNPGDARLLEEHLRDAPSLAATVERVERLDAVADQLKRRRADVMLLDLSLPDAHGMETVRRALEIAPELPIVVLTGLDDEAVAIQAVQAGAQDYLVKGLVDQALLSRSIRYAIERKQHSIRERILTEAAREASEAKSRFIAMMSHEFRTPLNAIVGYTGLIEAGIGGPVTARQQEYLGKIQAGSRHLVALIDDTLDLAKVEAGQMRLDLKSGLVMDVIAEAIALVAPQAAAVEIALENRASAAAACRYVGDQARVRQILLNLLSNAVKFTDQGGSVTMTTWEEAAPDREASLADDGPWAFIAVADTGIGIAPEEAAAVFQPFGRSQNESARKRSGTGLGLVISHELARRMGGDLTLESVVGEGSRFTLRLPAAPALDP